jgi:hypothetical protein
MIKILSNYIKSKIFINMIKKKMTSIFLIKIKNKKKIKMIHFLRLTITNNIILTTKTFMILKSQVKMSMEKLYLHISNKLKKNFHLYFITK